jgi:lipopolysaccharide/colanic/teichoic acid biosynthesis glycosyltransferase
MSDCYSGGVPVPEAGVADGERAATKGSVSFKSVVEFAFAALLFLLTLPLVLLSMALVRLTSRGPALYKQVRMGHHGRLFLIYKIRTMTHDCERETGPRWSPPSDPRVTRVGRFLRATHLDELPQLWNVLRGEMSLVGPRPERPEFVANLERVLPDYRDRMRVRPGVTGLAQVQLPPDTSVESVRRKLACDLRYVRRNGPLLDLRIVLATVLKLTGCPVGLRCRLLGIPIVTGLEKGDDGREALPEAETASQMQTA